MSANHKHGFSMVELMIVIGIIAVLVAIALPVLGGARSSARQSLALANLRSTHQLFDTYSSDNGQYPFRAAGDQPVGIDDPVDPDAVTYRWYPEGVVFATSNHFDIGMVWPAVVVELKDWPALAETWVSPGREFELPELDDLMNGGSINPGEMFSIVYSNSFVARPNLWTPDRGDTIDRIAELRPTRPSEVRAPAGKVMLWDRHLAYLSKEPERVGGHYRERTPMAFADGHGALHDPTDASPGVANPLNDGDETTLHNTREGVYGIDYD